MSRQKSRGWKCLGRKGARRLEIFILVVISILRVDSDQWVRHPGPVWTHYATNVGGIERVVLQDGTRVDLNTGSEIKARFTGGRREVVLTHGEALFSVMQRTNWPFSVKAGGATIHAVGTRFSVRLRDNDTTDVLVIQGPVAIEGAAAIEGKRAAAAQGAGPFALLMSGESIAMSSTSVLARATLSPATLSRRTAWTDGWICFSKDPLPQAVAEFNRYHLEQLVLVDPALASLEIGGRFRSTDLDSFIATLEHSFDVRATSAVVHGTGAAAIYLSGRCLRAQQQCNWPMVQ